MPAQWKKAEYKGSGRQTKIEMARESEWWRVSEGFTLGNRVCLEGEIFHISELDVQGPDGQNVESFRPLTLVEQERRFGRVMYMPYTPTEEELEALGYEREDIRAEDTASREQFTQLAEDEYKTELQNMKLPQLRTHAQERWNMVLPDSMPENRVRASLLKLHREAIEKGEA